MLETDKIKKNNDKFFQILGLDIMFDDNFNGWLIETNRFPSLDLFFKSPNVEGDLVNIRSTLDERIKSTLINE